MTECKLSQQLFSSYTKYSYEAKNGKAKAAKNQSPGRLDAGESFAGGGRRDQWGDPPGTTEQIRMDTESVAFRCGE